eukprot:1614343-Pyramimonas_sp.AAC.1
MNEGHRSSNQSLWVVLGLRRTLKTYIIIVRELQRQLDRKRKLHMVRPAGSQIILNQVGTGYQSQLRAQATGIAQATSKLEQNCSKGGPAKLNCA